jgi:hypothetical protein
MCRLSGIIVALAVVTIIGAVDLSGTWDVDVTFDDRAVEGGEIDCAITQEGAQLKGTCSGGTAQLTGEVSGRDIRWQIGGAKKSSPPGHTFAGTVDDAGRRIKGRFTAGGKDGSFTAFKSR